MRRWLALLALAVGCATGPSPELLQARAAYARAASGPAPRVVPNLLQTAKEDLDAAEASRGVEGRHRAYVALRRAETAEVSADGVLIVERLNQIDHALAEIQHGAADAPMVAERPARPPTSEPTHTVTIDKVVTPEIVSAPGPVAAAPAPAAPPATDDHALDRLARQGDLRTTARGLELTLPAASMFVAGVAKLAPEAMASLEDVAGAVKAAPGRDPVVLEVHTADGVSREAQLLLSQQRAEIVRSYLISRGVDPDRLIARGVGTDRPLGAAGGAHPTAGFPALAAVPGDDRLAVILPARSR
jgi:outer membrane protein OmpA-like peptidoglycan-associated protein